MYALFLSAALAAPPTPAPQDASDRAALELPRWSDTQRMENGRAIGRTGRYLLLGGTAALGAGMALAVAGCDGCIPTAIVFAGLGASAGVVGVPLAVAGPLVYADGLRVAGIPAPVAAGTAAVVLLGVAAGAGGLAAWAPSSGPGLGVLAAGSVAGALVLSAVQSGVNQQAEPSVTLAPTTNGLMLAGTF